METSGFVKLCISILSCTYDQILSSALHSQQEEEGDDADVSMTTSVSSHSIPLPLPSSFPPLYGARYSETTANTGAATTYGGLVAMEDPHEDDPESILDEHVQRVMKTPGCQSPEATNSSLGGGGRHTPPKTSRSPDGGIGPPHYPSHRGGGQSLPTVGAKGKPLRAPTLYPFCYVGSLALLCLL